MTSSPRSDAMSQPGVFSVTFVADSRSTVDTKIVRGCHRGPALGVGPADAFRMLGPERFRERPRVLKTPDAFPSNADRPVLTIAFGTTFPSCTVRRTVDSIASGLVSYSS